MMIFKIFVTKLIPSSQLLSGLFGTYPCSTAPCAPFEIAGVEHRSTDKAVAALNCAARDTLSLVSAWLVSGARSSPAELEAVAAELADLQALWVTEYRHLAMTVLKLKPATWQDRIARPRRAHPRSYDEKSVKKRLQALGAAQERLIARVYKILGYTCETRKQWLTANVNSQHILSEGGRPGKWRTLAKNSPLTELGRMLGHIGEREWRQSPHLASTIGTERLPMLLKSLHALQPKALEALAESAEGAVPTAAVPGASADAAPAVEALLPGNYAITRLPSGLVSLTVTGSTPVFGVRKGKLTDLPSDFQDSLSATERVWLLKKSESFQGTLSQGAELLEQARTWEMERKAICDDVQRRYAVYREKAKRDDLRMKLKSNFNAEERGILMELLAESKEGCEPDDVQGATL